MKTMRNNSFAPRARNGHRAVHDLANHKNEVARDKISRVFRYLEALNQHRNPVQRQLEGQLWTLWLHDLPDHSSVIQSGRAHAPVAGERSAARNEANNTAENFVFKVQRPTLSA